MVIERLLIANRGEIAVRIARTAHRLGISTVGVYSAPDADALHVDAVDRAVSLGGETPGESYLRADAVIAAALDTGCDAVHPGYGFLAESAAFARQVVDAGLVWVGPSPEQIERLGDKIAAKQAALEAGVPTTGSTVVGPDDIPADLPMPALVKAAAGGGGRGMRVVHTPAELGPAIEAASREAESAFGDGTVFVEPYVERGRHIEVQVLGDHHGAVIHLGERECSIQRRNQKIVEECPSPGIDDRTRAAVCDGAVALARHVGYHGAGTVEFLVAGDGTITFLEVNARLQVEHPVTEAVTGLDLVELQLRIAAGEPLPLTQEDVQIAGHAVEVRVVAEDPRAGWVPAGGALRQFAFGDGVRVDAGVGPGRTVSTDYDSLLAKVIAHDHTRDAAVRRLGRALRTARVSGVKTNVHALIDLLAERDFLAGRTSTAYLDEHSDVVATSGPAGEDRLVLLLGATFALEHDRRHHDRATGFAPSGWRNLRTQGERRRWASASGDVEAVEYVVDRDGRGATVLVGPWPDPAEDGTLPDDDRRQHVVRFGRRSADEQVLEIDGVRHVVGAAIVGGDDVVCDTWSAGGAATWTLEPLFLDHTAELTGSGPVSPLPGRILAVHVDVGDEVADGTPLVVVEAMKMEHTITAAADAVVTEVHCAVDDRVDAGDLLVSLTALEDPSDEP